MKTNAMKVKTNRMNMDYPLPSATRTSTPTLWMYRWHVFQDNFRHAGKNLHAILKFSPPQIVQFGNGLWAILWGISMTLKAPAILAVSPHLYAWMHASFLHGVPPRAWGVAALVLGLRQMYALSWPTGDRIRRCKQATRGLCRWWIGLLVGFLSSGVPSNANVFYVFLAGLSVWTLYRFEGRTECQF